MQILCGGLRADLTWIKTPARAARHKSALQKAMAARA
jgi:hypothetical protein